MLHVRIASKWFVFSRPSIDDRPIELVCRETGKLHYVKTDTVFDETTTLHKQTLPNNIEFPDRPASFVSVLAAARQAFLEESRLKKRRTSGPRKGKEPKDPNAPKTPRKSRATSRSASLIAQAESLLAAKLAAIPADIRAQLEQARKELSG